MNGNLNFKSIKTFFWGFRRTCVLIFEAVFGVAGVSGLFIEKKNLETKCQIQLIKSEAAKGFCAPKV